MAGEGCAFLHAPAGFGPRPADHRLVRRVRGFEPAAGKRRLCQGRNAVPRRDLRSVGAVPLQRRPANARREWPDDRARSRRTSPALQQQLLGAIADTPLAKRNCSIRSTRPHARFLAFRSPHAQRWYERLKTSNCITDVRGDVLRIGFGIYQDEEDVDRLAGLLRGLHDCSRTVVRNRGLLMTLLVLAYTLNFIDRQIAGILAEPIKHDLGSTDRPARMARRHRFRAFLYRPRDSDCAQCRSRATAASS